MSIKAKQMQMKTNYQTKHTPMKTLTRSLVVLFCCCTALLANAQCGLQVYFTGTTNPNGTAVFNNESTTSGGFTATAYSWSFGDGTGATTQHADHHYAQPGNYNVCLVVTAQMNSMPGTTCMDTFCTTYTAACASGLQISTTHQTGNGYAVYSATTTGGTGPFAYAWSNGSTAQTTTVQYNVGGTYDLCVTVTDASGCAVSECETAAVTVTTPCTGVQASFTQTTTANTVVLQSTSTGTGSGTLYQWEMDGVAITNPNPNTAYTVSNVPAGSHTFCLKVYANQNTLCDSECHTFYVPGTGPCGGAQANFTYTLSGNYLGVNAGANSYPAGTKFQWWLNGQSTTPSPTTIQQTWANLPLGANQVCLYIYSAGNDFCDSVCQTITVTSSNPCNVNMNAIFTTSTANGGTIFAANSNPSGTVYHWNFGDNTDANTTVPQTSHQYPADTNTHIYYACLITSIPGTLCADTFCVDVVVPGIPAGSCYAAFTWTTNPNGTIIFNNASEGGVTSWAWSFGDGSTGTGQTPDHHYAAPGVYNVCLYITAANNCTSTICHDVTVGGANTNDTLCGVVFNDANSNGVFDANENPLPAITIMAGNYTAVSDSDGFYQIIYPGTFAVDLHALGQQGCVPTLPLSTLNSGTNGSFYYVIPGNEVEGCAYNFGFNCNVVSVCGSVYFDANNNGTQDGGESGLSGVHIEVSGNGNTYHAYTSQNGTYCVTVPTGTYVIHAAANNYNTCALTPTQLSVAATTVGQQYANNNFAIYCQPGSCNLAITITPHTTVTPGFGAWYDVQVHNVGATIATGTASVFYDPNLTFNYASPAESAHNASTHTLSFTLPAMLPGDNEYYWLNFTAQQGLALNAPIFTLVNVISNCSDVNLTNNVDTVHQHVTGSWDPNNKLAYVTNYETDPAFQLISSIDANQRIEYVINFQNEGNGPAVNVVVKDLISSDLDISSFELIGTSHDCQVTLTGSDANFKFSNIMLPAKVTDEPNSHGFIKFAINANNNLPAGHVIADDAAIYFDYNPAVVTNESEVTLLEPTGIDEVSSVTATIAPNPMNQYATIRLNNNSNDGFKLRVTDVTGRIVSEQITSNNNLLFERNSLSAGMYTYQIIQNNKAVAKGKLVIQ